MKIDVVRAWKDARYRNSLSEEERALLPENPIGSFELVDAQLSQVVGGSGTAAYTDSGTPGSCCSEPSVSDVVRCCSQTCTTPISCPIAIMEMQ